MKILRLTEEELLDAAEVGVRRRVRSIAKGRAARYGHPERGAFESDVMGAIGEYAVSRLLDRFWNARALLDGRPGDVAGFEVRTTAHATGRLVLHEGDGDDVAFYFVRVHALPAVEVFGPALAGPLKRPDFWSDPTGSGRPAFFVPVSALEPEPRHASP